MSRIQLSAYSLLVLSVAALTSGCQTGQLARYSLFPRGEITSYETPSMRIIAAKKVGRLADGTDSAEQQELTQGLAMKLQTETNPLVRESLLKACGEFRTPMATRALIAGLQDSNEYVRQTCCQKLGRLQSSDAISELARIAQGDEVFDVRVAAAQALGQTGSPAAQRGLVAALEDRNPAMQITGIEAMRNLTGQELGNDVSAYAAIARSDAPTPPQTPQVVVPQTETKVAIRPDSAPLFK